MTLQPNDWNIVVAGYWNKAILTPSGIARKLFALEKDVPVDVQVALDGISPPRVRNQGQIVVVNDGHLIVHPETCNAAGLTGSFEIVKRAKAALPETPIMAFGLNMRYVTNEPSADLLRHMDGKIDADLAELNLEVLSRTLTRKISFDVGIANIKIGLKSDDSGIIDFNFHCDAQDQFDAWLNIPLARFIDLTQRVVNQIAPTDGVPA